MEFPTERVRKDLGDSSIKEMTIFITDVINFIHPFQKAVVHHRAAFWLYLLLAIPISVHAAEEPEDTVHDILPELEVRQQSRSPIRKTDDGRITVRTKDILRLSRAFGEADLMEKIRTLPLAESTGDYSSGLSIDGSEPGQTQYLVNGAPVIFPYRFGGIFSTFNASHFSSMSFTRLTGASLPPRLGAVFQLSPSLRFRSGVEGSVSAGMTASSLSVHAGVSDRVAISVSGRVSYIDKIYGNWLSSSEKGIKYSFHDLNADVAFRISDSDVVSLTFLRTEDNLNYDDIKYALNTSIGWNNTLYSAGYRHKGETDLSLNIHHSRFADRLALTMPRMRLEAPASLSTSGADVGFGKENTDSRIAGWKCGVRLIHDHTEPQWARMEIISVDDAAVRASEVIPQNMLTAVTSGAVGWWIIRDCLRLDAETGIGLFHSRTKGMPNYYSLIFTPSVGLIAYIHNTRLAVRASILNQPMHRVGFSELGLATDFWIGAYSKAPVQRAFALTGNVTKRLPCWNLDLEAGAFWNAVRNQVEYQGQVIETIDTEYSPFSHLIVADGCNYGAYASIQREFGAITGGLNISYGNGRRHNTGDRSESWHALRSQGLVMKASAIWTDGSHWTISAAFRLASGRRYTPVDALYMIGGNVAMEYGKLNSARLPLYHRLDIGATYSFSTDTKIRLRHIFNLSLLNAYGHKNVEMQYFVLNSKDGEYSLKRLYSLYRFLPSISYTIEFR